MRRIALLLLTLLMLAPASLIHGQKITLYAANRPAERIFTEIMRQSGMNFIYTSDILKGLTFTVDVKDTPLEKVLEEIFSNTDIDFRIKGRNVTLFRRSKTNPKHNPITVTVKTDTVHSLPGVEINSSRNYTLTMESPEVGALNLNRSVIASTPVVFGESDVIKTLQLEPGVSAGVEGLAGMYVHGGNADENLYMLDNVPLYQVNHFGGLFSAFNTEAIHNVDFYKSTFPARFDGRLSSYMNVQTKEGGTDGHHGSFRLGLTSGAFNIDGPLRGDHTTYSIAVRRSWYDLFLLPAVAIYNKVNHESNLSLGYAFTDINARIDHKFSPRSKAHVGFYFGDDYLKLGEEDKPNKNYNELDGYKNSLRWGNLLASAGWDYSLSHSLIGHLTGAFTRYRTKLFHESYAKLREEGKTVSQNTDRITSRNHINDWLLKADFDWIPGYGHNVDFGTSFTFHHYLPLRTTRTINTPQISAGAQEQESSFRATEFNLYVSDNWSLNDNLRINYGAHFSLFRIDGKTHTGLSPRLSVRYTPADGWAVKAGYARTVQYVHQIMESALSLPTDQWVPIVGAQKPPVSDQISIGAYHSLPEGFSFSLEAYWKKMNNLLEYGDEHYLLPPDSFRGEKMTAGSGRARGIDFKVTKEFGKFTGHLSYSLLWADRRFPDRNGGRRYPATYDNRHKINVLLNWKISPKWDLSASWTGMSGNRMTLPTQIWSDPMIMGPYGYDMYLPAETNNVRLPFYHRLDLNFRRNTRRGFWDFSLYNAYCNMNTIAIVTAVHSSYFHYSYSDSPGHTYKKLRLLPIIPSVSYTWLF